MSAVNSTLKVALLHLAVERGQPDQNLANLLAMAERAAEMGARLIVAPEMALSGYCFEDRESLWPHARTARGSVVTALRGLARRRGVYLVVGLAEREEPSQILFNSAFFLDDQGQIMGRARKINSESRWACPGPQIQANVWPTPWGRVGILICADTWNSLIVRITALKGAEMLIVPANWPAAGLDPRDLWRFRAQENGLWLVACNRTGAESNLDCQAAVSCAYDPYGEELFRGQSLSSEIFFVELPLDANGQLDTQRRREILANRTPWFYHRLYGNFTGIRDLTGFLKLPPPGPLRLWFHLGEPESVESELAQVEAAEPGIPTLILLPPGEREAAELESLDRLARPRGLLTVGLQGERHFLGELTGEKVGRAEGLYLFDYGSARIWLARPEEIIQPEAAIAAAKSGADLAICFLDRLTPAWRRLALLRPIDQLVTVLVARDEASLGHLWVGHEAGQSLSVGPGESLGSLVDTGGTRDKRFQDRLDFAALFQAEPGSARLF
ncbi:MAG: carbon-nitrogen hydrolase family protein [Deltaproteobacteria bacterium]|jgi:predicted amidohydrolase|nr:carbon-nitrogen hydrolase family protein [Deltaproteobacteria bacterium]